MTLAFDEVQISQGSQIQTVMGDWHFKTTVRKITEGVTNRTWVEYEVRGKDPQRQMSAWWIENYEGERFLFDRYDQIRTIEDRYSYRTKLAPIDPNEKLKIAVLQIKSPNILKELEFVIPLKE